MISSHKYFLYQHIFSFPVNIFFNRLFVRTTTLQTWLILPRPSWKAATWTEMERYQKRWNMSPKGSLFWSLYFMTNWVSVVSVFFKGLWKVLWCGGCVWCKWCLDCLSTILFLSISGWMSWNFIHIIFPAIGADSDLDGPCRATIEMEQNPFHLHPHIADDYSIQSPVKSQTVFGRCKFFQHLEVKSFSRTEGKNVQTASSRSDSIHLVLLNQFLLVHICFTFAIYVYLQFVQINCWHRQQRL